MTVDAVGGVWTFALELCRNFPTTRFVLACMGPEPDKGQRREAASLANAELLHEPFHLEWMDEPWDDVRAADDWLMKIEASFKPDLIHLNGYAHASLPWRAPVMVTAHSCVLSWWKAVKGEDAPARWDRYQREVARGLEAADLTVAPSHAMAEALMRHYHVPAGVQVIYNGRRGRRLQDAGAKEPMILSVGRLWDEAKNAMALAEIAADLPWPVVMAGDAVSPQGTLPALPNVRLTGHLPAEQVEAYYDRASIFALPGRYEPFGLSALEAALAGCALVLGDIPTFREIWGDAAIYVSPDDPPMLRRMLMRLIGNPSELRRLASKARSRALLYSSARMLEGYGEAYGSLLQMAHPPFIRPSSAVL